MSEKKHFRLKQLPVQSETNCVHLKLFIYIKKEQVIFNCCYPCPNIYRSLMVARKQHHLRHFAYFICQCFSLGKKLPSNS